MKTDKMIKVVLMAALTAVGAYILIPVGPVPITLQTFFVLTAAVFSNYLIGSIYFALITGTGILASLNLTVIPFIPGDLLKIILVLILAPIIENRLSLN